MKKSRERGSALVEAGLIFLLAFSLLIGVLDVGQVMFIHQMIAERARSAARWASVNPYDPSKTANLVLYGATTSNPGAELFGMRSSNVTVVHNGAGTQDDRVEVTVSGYTYLFFTGAFIGRQVSSTGLTVHASVPYEYTP